MESTGTFRTERLELRITSDEKTDLHNRAASYGCTMSEYIRNILRIDRAEETFYWNAVKKAASIHSHWDESGEELWCIQDH